MRTKYLGPGWDLAKVRGTRYDTGDGIQMALDAGAASRGHWSGCHSVGWDLNAPAFGDIAVGDGFNKHNYKFGIMVNATGERFLDEGADIRNYTYAKYGRVILAQPGQFAWQVFDARRCAPAASLSSTAAVKSPRRPATPWRNWPGGSRGSTRSGSWTPCGTSTRRSSSRCRSTRRPRTAGALRG